MSNSNQSGNKTGGAHEPSCRKAEKIGIINFYEGQNYGANYLAYALVAALGKIGAQGEMIRWLSQKTKNLKFSNLRAFVIYLVLNVPKSIAFRRFHKNLPQSAKSYTDETLHGVEKLYDKFMIGSDICWSTREKSYNENFFLPFVKEPNRKVSFGASIAQPDIPEQMRARYRELVDGFGYVTSREEHTRELLETYTDIKAPRTADPVFLLGAEEWRCASLPDKKRRRPFLFVYHLHLDDKAVTLFAEELAKENDLEVVYCPMPIFKQIRCRRRPWISPEQMLWYLDNAKMVITDSFHGTALSIIFNTPFYAVVPGSAENLASRIYGLLERYSLQDRLLNKGDSLHGNKSPDWDAVNAKTDQEREHAYFHLRAMVDL